jgi:heterodisulfide reductase subunit A
VTYEDIAGEGGMKRAEHDLVVLSVGVMPNLDALGLFKHGQLEASQFSYIRESSEDLHPGRTNIEGVFVAGGASEARDIPDSILHAGAAAAQAAAHVERIKRSQRTAATAASS